MSLASRLVAARPSAALGSRAVAGGACALVAGTGLASGGYFPGSWGWTALAAAWAAALALLVDDDVAVTRTAGAYAALLAAFAAWTTLGSAWTIDATQTALDAERNAVYAAAALAGVLWARRYPHALLAGAWAGATILCCWGLLTRLVPDRFGVVDAISGYRLSEPIGYWNSLGLLAAAAALLAVGLAARARASVRVLAAASLPLLLATLYFTFSRGAWIALFGGLAAALLLDRRRVQLGAVAAAAVPWIALVLWRAATSDALTSTGAPLDEAARQGHRVLAVAVAASLLAAAAALALRRVEPRLELPPRALPAVRAGAALALVVALATVFATFGSPVTIVRDAWTSFASAAPARGSSLNNRLFQLSGSGRTTQWRVAWEQSRAHPWLGSGAGTYEVFWARDRPSPSRVRDVHNLYLEVLAEQGPLGLALLAGALVLPLVAVVRRRFPLAAVAAGAYVAFLLHAIVDWDWEITGVTLVPLLCGAALVAEPARRLRPPGRRLALAASILFAAASVYTIATRISIDRLESALDRGDAAAAVRHAHEASALAPWSSEPWLRLGEAELNAGLTGAAWGHFRTAVVEDPRNWVAWWDLARASVGVERTHALAQARRLNPLEPQVRDFEPGP